MTAIRNETQAGKIPGPSAPLQRRAGHMPAPLGSAQQAGNPAASAATVTILIQDAAEVAVRRGCRVIGYCWLAGRAVVLGGRAGRRAVTFAPRSLAALITGNGNCGRDIGRDAE